MAPVANLTVNKTLVVRGVPIGQVLSAFVRSSART
jgi:hypothetical protein